MIVYWVALIEALFYLCAIPLHIAVYFRSGDGLRFSAGLAVFEGEYARRRAFRRLSKEKRPFEDMISGFTPSRARLALDILPHPRVVSIRVNGSFSAGDAAVTAMLTGGIRALECAFRPLFADMVFRVTPDFNASRSYADLCGMISLRSGQIIYAALSGAVKNTNRRVTQWINIRSKA